MPIDRLSHPRKFLATDGSIARLQLPAVESRRTASLLLLTTYYLSLTTYYSLLTTHYLPLTTYYSLLTTHYLLVTSYLPAVEGHRTATHLCIHSK